MNRSAITNVADNDEVWYCWRILGSVEGDKSPRLLTPWADPHKYEFPFNFVYETPQRARIGLATMGAEDEAYEERWVLCRMTLQPVGTAVKPMVEEP